jgi:hypothetical protein
VTLYKKAIALFEQAGAVELAGETWRALSRLRLRQGRWMEALAAYDAGLDSPQRLTLTQHALRRLIKTSRRLLTPGQT